MRLGAIGERFGRARSQYAKRQPPLSHGDFQPDSSALLSYADSLEWAQIDEFNQTSNPI